MKIKDFFNFFELEARFNIENTKVIDIGSSEDGLPLILGNN